jgi:hypothetical protein
MSDENPKQRRIRGAIGRSLMKLSPVRRWYIRRMIKFMDKSRDKGRRLPPEFVDMARYLSKVPKSERAAALEKAFLAQQEGVGTSRDYRRAAAAQQRRSGRGGGRYRPGLPPGALQEARRLQAGGTKAAGGRAQAGRRRKG